MNTNKRMDEGWIGECDNRKLNMDTQDAQDYQGGALLQGLQSDDVKLLFTIDLL